MSFVSLDRLRHTIGFRLTLWYSGVFMLSVLILFALSYALLWSSLRHTDRENITQELYELAATADLQWVEVAAHSGGSRLEVASLGLFDGSVLQVGKSTADRRHVLRHFRAVFASVILAVILLGVGCGTLLAFHTL